MPELLAFVIRKSSKFDNNNNSNIISPPRSILLMNTHAAISLADEIYTALNDRLCQIKQQQVDSNGVFVGNQMANKS